MEMFNIMPANYDTDMRFEKVLKEIHELQKEKHGYTEYDDEGRKDIIASLRRITNNPEHTDFNEEAAEYIRNIYTGNEWIIEDEIINGIDLIFRKEDKIVLIKFSVSGQIINEENIHQFLGAVMEYKIDSPEDLKIGAVFYTSASFSEGAKKTANKFHIKLINLKEGFYFQEYYM